jgi:hypothetical protein
MRWFCLIARLRSDAIFGNDRTVHSGEWAIGPIYEVRGSNADMRWFWSFHATSVPATIRSSGHVPSLEEAKGQFAEAWEAWKAWAKLAELE